MSDQEPKEENGSQLPELPIKFNFIPESITSPFIDLFPGQNEGMVRGERIRLQSRVWPSCQWNLPIPTEKRRRLGLHILQVWYLNQVLFSIAQQQACQGCEFYSFDFYRNYMDTGIGLADCQRLWHRVCQKDPIANEITLSRVSSQNA